MTTDNRPTICQVLHSLQIGGAEVLAAGIARELTPQFRFVFACLDELGTLGEQLQDEGFPTIVLGRQPGIDWKCGFRLAKFLREQRVDVVHAHQYTPFFQALLSRLAYRKPPVIFTEHGRHHPDYRSAKRVAVNRLLVRKDDRFIGVGKSVAQALIDNEGLPSDRVEVVYNGVKLGPFEAARHDADLRASVRNEFGLQSTDFVIAQVARLNPLKDHETSLRMMVRLADQPSIKLLLIGDGETWPQIQQFINFHNIQDRVLVAGARRDIPRILGASDAFLLSSISEGIPLTIIEAMAAGIPVISTNVGGVSEVIQHERTGLLADSENDSQLADAVRRTVSRPDLRESLVTAASIDAHERFSLTRMLESYRDIYRQLSATGAVDVENTIAGAR